MNSMKDTVDKYREEMMRLYGKKGTSEKNSAEAEKEEERIDTSEKSVEERYPIPEIPDFIKQNTKPPNDMELIGMTGDENETEYPESEQLQNDGGAMEYNNEESRENGGKMAESFGMPQNTASAEDMGLSGGDEAFGFLQVQVRTGDSGYPLENAAVTISRNENGRERIYMLAVTDKNGETESIKLPTYRMVSDPDEAEDYEKYRSYDVSVYVRGYFPEGSSEVPIFENIKSIQTFNLVPEPYGQNTIN